MLFFLLDFTIFFFYFLIQYLLQLHQPVSFFSPRVSEYAASLFCQRSFCRPILRKALDLRFQLLSISLLFPVLSNQWFQEWQCLLSHAWHQLTDSLLQSLHLLFVLISRRIVFSISFHRACP